MGARRKINTSPPTPKITPSPPTLNKHQSNLMTQRSSTDLAKLNNHCKPRAPVSSPSGSKCIGRLILSPLKSPPRAVYLSLSLSLPPSLAHAPRASSLKLEQSIPCLPSSDLGSVGGVWGFILLRLLRGWRRWGRPDA
jgi:hypothetical protein